MLKSARAETVEIKPKPRMPSGQRVVAFGEQRHQLLPLLKGVVDMAEQERHEGKLQLAEQSRLV